jgi:hypothetical protein
MVEGSNGFCERQGIEALPAAALRIVFSNFASWREISDAAKSLHHESILCVWCAVISGAKFFAIFKPFVYRIATTGLFRNWQERRSTQFSCLRMRIDCLAPLSPSAWLITQTFLPATGLCRVVEEVFQAKQAGKIRLIGVTSRSGTASKTFSGASTGD